MLSEWELARVRILASENSADLPIKKSILRYTPDSFIASVLSIILSVVLGKLPLKPEEHQYLKKGSRILHKLVLPGESLEVKRRLLAQQRSLALISTLLRFVLPQLGEEAASPWINNSNPSTSGTVPAGMEKSAE